MKKHFILLLLYMFVNFTCFALVLHKNCDHEWMLTNIDNNGTRYWTCSICGDTYKTKQKNITILSKLKSLNFPWFYYLMCLYTIVFFVLVSKPFYRIKIKTRKISFVQMSYNSERHIRNFLCATVPFFTSFFLIRLKTTWGKIPYVGAFIAFTTALFFSFIGIMFGYSINISRAKDIGLQDDDENVDKEKLKKKIGLASGILGGCSLFKHSKKTLKDFTNVDGWKEMK